MATENWYCTVVSRGPRIHPLSCISPFPFSAKVPAPVFFYKPPPPILLWLWNLAMLKPLKTIAICHVKEYFVVFLHQTASKSTEIVWPRGDLWSVMVVTRNYHDPAHKPPPLFCLMLACRKAYCGILRYMYIRLSDFVAIPMISLECHKKKSMGFICSYY